ncbi:hypothetical protein AFLA_012268 [Aspergillus flavus NRRL3357]|nr:hypothetical protein AFLA_012268 [Aspergillus flavus NRRL3357]
MYGKNLRRAFQASYSQITLISKAQNMQFSHYVLYLVAATAMANPIPIPEAEPNANPDMAVIEPKYCCL